MLAIALICASLVAHGDCTKETARAVMPLPPEADVRGLADCALKGQIYVSANHLMDPNTEYTKVLCTVGPKPPVG